MLYLSYHSNIMSIQNKIFWLIFRLTFRIGEVTSPFLKQREALQVGWNEGE